MRALALSSLKKGTIACRIEMGSAFPPVASVGWGGGKEVVHPSEFTRARRWNFGDDDEKRSWEHEFDFLNSPKIRSSETMHALVLVFSLNLCRMKWTD